MELAAIFRELWNRKLLLVIGVAVSLAAAIFSVYRVVKLVPPKLEQRSLVYAGGFTEAYVDAPHSFLGDQTVNLGGYVDRATIFANLLASPGAVQLIGSYAGIPGDQIYAAGPLDPSEQRVVQEPTAIKRNIELTGESDPYQLQFLADPNLPTIGIYSQAPTVAQATALANASVRALREYIASLPGESKLLPQDQVVIRQIGQPTAAIVDASIKKKLAGLVFFATLFAWCVLVMIGIRLRAGWRRAAQRGRPVTAVPPAVPAAVPAAAVVKLHVRGPIRHGTATEEPALAPDPVPEPESAIR